MIVVRDSGIGFTSADGARIFEPFVQIESSRSQAAGGLGLGLTLVRALVTMHSGSVEAKSAGPGHGAEFTVRLPLAAAAQAIVPPPPPTKTSTRSTRRILVVDDNVDAADTLAELLSFDGFDVRKSYNGADALALARQSMPDVAFLDMNMPGMPGIEVGRALRALPGGAAIRLVALTGMGQKTDVAQTREAGFDAHLTKPASVDEVRREAAGGTLNVVSFDPARRA